MLLIFHLKIFNHKWLQNIMTCFIMSFLDNCHELWGFEILIPMQASQCAYHGFIDSGKRHEALIRNKGLLFMVRKKHYIHANIISPCLSIPLGTTQGSKGEWCTCSGFALSLRKPKSFEIGYKQIYPTFGLKWDIIFIILESEKSVICFKKNIFQPIYTMILKKWEVLKVTGFSAHKRCINVRSIEDCLSIFSVNLVWCGLYLKVKVAPPCPTLCNSMGYTVPGTL